MTSFLPKHELIPSIPFGGIALLMKHLTVAIGLALVLATLSSCSRDAGAPVPLLKLDAPQATAVVATLDTPIPPGKSAIWCASFLAAWKSLAQDLAKEPVALNEPSGLVDSLNGAPDPRPTIPPSALYVATGWNDKGIVAQIQKEVVRKFPATEPPTFPGILPDSFVAYSCLEAGVKFSLPYCQNRQPLPFTDSQGRQTPITAFGIREEDHDAYDRLRAQSRVLFRTGEEHERNLEFAIDLCSKSQPSQIVVARIKREPTLAAAIARVNRETLEMDRRSNPGNPEYLRKVGPTDVLLVPDLFWQLSHHFAELEGKRFTNAKLKGQRLDVAQQDILFRLNRSGAELKSKAEMYATGITTHFTLDRPFLIYMCQRGAKTPYFALWVDNAELLNKWQEAGSAQGGGSVKAKAARP